MIEQSRLPVDIKTGIFQFKIKHQHSDGARESDQKQLRIKELYHRRHYPHSQPHHYRNVTIAADLGFILEKAHRNYNYGNKREAVCSKSARSLRIQLARYAVVIELDRQRVYQYDRSGDEDPVTDHYFAEQGFRGVNIGINVHQREEHNAYQRYKVSFTDDLNGDIRKKIASAYGYAGKNIKRYADKCHTERVNKSSARMQFDPFLTFVEIKQYQH